MKLPGGAQLFLDYGDITTIATDAIVNAANPTLLGGGGVDGAIHRAAGPALLRACRAKPVAGPRGERCPVGEARITSAGNLPAYTVIHTVGPVFSSARASAPLLYSAYASSLRLAKLHGLARIAFPAISCGVYGYPASEAAYVAMRAFADNSAGLKDIRVVLNERRTAACFTEAARWLEAQLGDQAAREQAEAHASVPGEDGGGFDFGQLTG